MSLGCGEKGEAPRGNPHGHGDNTKHHTACWPTDIKPESSFQPHTIKPKRIISPVIDGEHTLFFS